MGGVIPNYHRTRSAPSLVPPFLVDTRMLASLKRFYRSKQRKPSRRARRDSRYRWTVAVRAAGKPVATLRDRPTAPCPMTRASSCWGMCTSPSCSWNRTTPPRTGTANAIAAVKSRVDEGLQWWTSALAQTTDRHTLRFQTDYTYADQPVPTSYNPLENPSTAAADWIYDFLVTVGFDRPAGVNRDWGLVSSDIRAFNHCAAGTARDRLGVYHLCGQ